MLQRFWWPFQALALASFWWCCALLPPHRATMFGAKVARTLGPHLRWHNRLRDNLTIALPQTTGGQISRLARDAWGSFGATLAQYPHLGTIADRRFGEHIDLIVSPEVERHHARGKPFVFITAHVGNWEISTAAATRMGIPLSVVYAAQRNPMIDWMVQRYRRALGCGFIAKDAGVRPLIQQLQAGRSLGMLVDQRVRSGASLPFFGETTKTTLVPARLAIKYGCPLVPVRVEHLGEAKFRITFLNPIYPPHDGSCHDLQAKHMMQAANELLEAWITERPEQWQCLQNRWPKTVRKAFCRQRKRGGPAMDSSSREAGPVRSG